jgi:hypothetical protein
MSKLTTAKKKAEPKSDFGLPKERKYPMPDASHARNAKARASQMEHQGKLSASDKKKPPPAPGWHISPTLQDRLKPSVPCRIQLER